MLTTKLLLLLIVTLLIRHGASEVNITISPADVDEGLTESFTAICTFSPTLGTLVTLTLSRANDTSGAFQELTSINGFSTQAAAQQTVENFTVAANFNASGLSSLKLHWSYPTVDQKGVYKCSAAGLDTLGHNILEEDAATLTVGRPGQSQLLDKLKQMDALLRSFEDKVTALETKVLHLETNFTQEVNESKFDLEMKFLNLERNLTYVAAKNKGNTEQLDQLKSIFFVDSISFNDTEYFLSRDSFGNANVSAAICAMYGGYLVEFDDAAEFEAVTSFIHNFTGFFNVYVGGGDSRHENHWEFGPTGRNVTWTNWYQGEPNSGPGADCIKIYKIYDWQMLDAGCYSQDPEYRFICEVPLTT
ncbi:unnamed protein product [Lymnaea stagnalis]|uniref:C-type lectin domain-containing protein n=1 Tax=Lymnaea stagnalis TaxID=6523 RepID=A0AAV2I1L8_LYMST